ncbi:MAG TPA: helix-turn-helix domain-containing protein, partial [Actinomycetota bacterium]|nr:helix-turn-helix domain-containing protein [Actinomycetota bacterium]
MSPKRPVWLGADKHVWDHVRVHLQLLEDPRLSPYEVSVWLAIAYHANLQTGSAFPAQKTIATLAKCSERQVRSALRVLEERGYIEIVDRPGKSSSYNLLSPPDLAEEPRQVVPHTPAGGAAHPGRSFHTGPAGGATEQEPIEQEPLNKVSLLSD